MITDRTYVYEFEQMLMGQIQGLNYCLSLPDGERIKAGRAIWRYVIEDMLHWTPEEALVCMDDALLRLLRLDGTLTLFGYQRRQRTHPDYGFILHYVYPQQINYGTDQWVIDSFCAVAHLGRWAHDPQFYAYPPNFFAVTQNIDGQARINLLLRYIVNQFLWGSISVEEIYKLFADNNRARNFLSKYKLWDKYGIFYDSPLEFLHSALPIEQRNDFFYYLHVINNEWHRKKAN